MRVDSGGSLPGLRGGDIRHSEHEPTKPMTDRPPPANIGPTRSPEIPDPNDIIDGEIKSLRELQAAIAKAFGWPPDEVHPNNLVHDAVGFRTGAEEADELRDRLQRVEEERDRAVDVLITLHGKADHIRDLANRARWDRTEYLAEKMIERIDTLLADLESTDEDDAD